MLGLSLIVVKISSVVLSRSYFYQNLPKTYQKPTKNLPETYQMSSQNPLKTYETKHRVRFMFRVSGRTEEANSYSVQDNVVFPFEFW